MRFGRSRRKAEPHSGEATTRGVQADDASAESTIGLEPMERPRGSRHAGRPCGNRVCETGIPSGRRARPGAAQAIRNANWE